MDALLGVQVGVLWVIALAGLAFQVFALVDALTHRADAYTATSNQTKPIWLGINAVAVLIGIVCLPNFLSPLNFFFLIAIVAPGVYMTRVRPALRAITGRGGRSSSSGW